MTLGIIAGSSLLGSELFSGLRPSVQETPYGNASLMEGQGFLFIQRHGPDMDTLPHMIEHRANIHALTLRGVDRIIAVCSTGSYKKDVPPGSIVIPHDFMCLYPTPSFFDCPTPGLTQAFTLPGIDPGLREVILAAAGKTEVAVTDGGVYLQVSGPRLETVSEVRIFRLWADIVGMTMASEAILSKEAGIKYAAICQVDNFGRGIGGSEIDFADMEKAKLRALLGVKAILANILEART